MVLVTLYVTRAPVSKHFTIIGVTSPHYESIIMNKSTLLNVLWGVYNNPVTPSSKKTECLALIQAALESSDNDKLVKKIEEVLNG